MMGARWLGIALPDNHPLLDHHRPYRRVRASLPQG